MRPEIFTDGVVHEFVRHLCSPQLPDGSTIAFSSLVELDHRFPEWLRRLHDNDIEKLYLCFSSSEVRGLTYYQKWCNISTTRGIRAWRTQSSQTISPPCNVLPRPSPLLHSAITLLRKKRYLRRSYTSREEAAYDFIFEGHRPSPGTAGTSQYRKTPPVWKLVLGTSL